MAYLAGELLLCLLHGGLHVREVRARAQPLQHVGSAFRDAKHEVHGQAWDASNDIKLSRLAPHVCKSPDTVGQCLHEKCEQKPYLDQEVRIQTKDIKIFHAVQSQVLPRAQR
jgi:hypothetical protein